MGLIDSLKRRLPIVGTGAPRNDPAARPAAPVRSPRPPDREEEPMPVSARGNKPVSAYIEETIKANPVVIFMKGTPISPQCGFSATASGILLEHTPNLHSVDVIADPEVREGVKQLTSWPTIPQIFIGGEFVGGADIVRQMHEQGELKALIQKAVTPA
jgi:monothiol glutaredoxin